MTWAKLKEKIEERIVTIVFALVTFLCIVIWQAVPTEGWAKLGSIIPKRALASAIGLLLIALSTAIAYIFSLRRRLRALNVQPNFTYRFGIYWDDQLNPRCPHCSAYLTMYEFQPLARKSAMSHFSCTRCGRFIPVTDDDSVSPIRFQDARARIIEEAELKQLNR